MPFKFLAVTAAILAFLGIGAAASSGAIEAAKTKINCDRVASPLGSNSDPGTVADPFLTVDKLLTSLRSGQTGCLRAGVYQRDVEVRRGGSFSSPITLTSYPGERATLLGRLYVNDHASNVIFQQLDLDGYNRARLPSPTVNGDNVVFRDNDITNRNTSICFLLGSREYGRAKGTLIERNRIHNCGQLPYTNHHHGIYVEASDNVRITDNWIYDNADRGVQLFPDAQHTYVARNVIDGNGQGVVVSRTSARNIIENNIISNPVVRYNLEDFDLVGPYNIARRNCLWSTRHPGNPGGVQPQLAFAAVENIVIDPGFVNRAAKDFRVLPGSPCINFPLIPQTAPPKPRKQLRRPVRLSSATSTIWPGERVRLRAQIPSSERDGAARAVLRLRRGGEWWRVATMRGRANVFTASVRLEKRRQWRRFGQARVWSGRRTLRLRASVRGLGISNIVVVRIGR